jgi:hypothetical protein
MCLRSSARGIELACGLLFIGGGLLLDLTNRTDVNSYDHFITELFVTADCLGCPQCFATLDADCDVMGKKIVLVGNNKINSLASLIYSIVRLGNVNFAFFQSSI